MDEALSEILKSLNSKSLIILSLKKEHEGLVGCFLIITSNSEIVFELLIILTSLRNEL